MLDTSKCLLTIAAEEAVFVVNSLGISGDLFHLTVFTQASHIIGFLELLRTVHAAQENYLVLHTHTESVEKINQPYREMSLFKLVRLLFPSFKTVVTNTRSK